MQDSDGNVVGVAVIGKTDGSIEWLVGGFDGWIVGLSVGSSAVVYVGALVGPLVPL